MALTKKQKDLLNKQKIHHTSKHMTMMRKLMNQGKQYKQQHKIAKSKVGKKYEFSKKNKKMKKNRKIKH